MGIPQLRSLLAFALILPLLAGCAASGGSSSKWIVSGIALAPDEAYVVELIANCRATPTKACRDRAVDACIGLIDGVYYEAKAGFLAGGGASPDDQWWSFIPVLNLVFAVASSRESQASKVADMSAGTALLNGFRSIFRRPQDKGRLLDDKDVLVAQMEDDRERIAQLIEIKSMRDIEGYTLEQALSDVGRYRAAGTPGEARSRLASRLGI